MDKKIIVLLFYLGVYAMVNTAPKNTREVTRIPSSHNAVVTFLTFNGFEGCWNAENYYRGAAKLGVSWKKFGDPKFDMVLMVSHGMCHTKLWSFQSLMDIGWRIVEIDKPIYTDGSMISGSRYQHTLLLTKLYVWTLRYDLVFYLDADTLIVRPLPMEEIKNSKTNVHSLGMEVNEAGKADGAGVMVITPSLKEFRQLYNAKDSEYDRMNAEQALLQKFYSPLNNRSKYALTFISPPQWKKAKDASVIHFCGNNKPWDSNMCNKVGFQHYCDIWNDACDNASCM